jgi:capping protein alpha
MSDYEEPIDDETKVSIAAEFMKYAPPGEFNEVYNDVAKLIANDELLRQATSEAVGEYNIQQFTPVELGESEKCLLTVHSLQPTGRYFDPKSKKSFKYDHIKHTASDIRHEQTETHSESRRIAIQDQVEDYVRTHYPNGTTSVYAPSPNEIVICIEDHEFQAGNFWGGRWRSHWTLQMNGPKAEIDGILRIQVHYYEDGNVQLLSKKDINSEISIESDVKFAAELVKMMKKAENEYQSAISENYVKMSDTTFRALRRQLPVTRTKIDWQKLLGYKIGKEASQQSNQ